MLGAFASRICGSADIFSKSPGGPGSSINIVTCHDGFTLNDLVSYARKHNSANEEDERDGTDANYSDNYGIEGETADLGIERVRERQIKNFLLTLFISRGVPMILGGDEFRRTQRGNNNAYCQDNEVSWVNWSDLQRRKEIFRFAQGMIAFRLAHQVFRKQEFYESGEISWYDAMLAAPGWSDPGKKSVACMIKEEDRGSALFMMFNAGVDGVDFTLPQPLPESRWVIAVDTFRPAPEDRLGSRRGGHGP